MTMHFDKVNHGLDAMDDLLRKRIEWRSHDGSVVSNDILLANQMVIMQALRMLLTMVRLR